MNQFTDEITRGQKQISVGQGGSQNEWVKSYTDMLGNTVKVERPSPTGTGLATQYFYYDAVGRLVRSVDADGVTMLYSYNALGERRDVAIDINLNGSIDYDGIDRIQRTLISYPEYNGRRVSATQTFVWDTDNVGAANGTGAVEVSRTYNKLGVTSSTAQSWSWSYPNSPNATQTSRMANLDLTVSEPLTTITGTLVDGSSVVQEIKNGRPKTEIQKDSTSALLIQTSFEYDAHGRLWKSIDSHNGTIEYTYHDDDQIASVTTPDPDLTRSGDGYDPQVTSFDYTNDTVNGLTRTTTLPDSTTVTEVFYSTGELKETYGSQTYPVVYTYDPQGRMRTLTTWQDKTADTGAVMTAWEYHPNGLLKQKWYEASIAGDGTISGTAGSSYTYTDAGRLKTRTNARGTVATYVYDPSTHDLTGTTYDDGITNAVNYAQYDRQGRIKQISDTSGTREFSYENGQQTDESYINGVLNTYSIDRNLDSLNRVDTLTLSKSLTELYRVDYGYDAASRLKTIAHGQHTVTYTYDPTAELREIRTFNNGAADVLKAEHRYDYLNRLKSITNLDASLSTLNSYSYQYNDLNQRTRMTLADNSYWQYTYDAFGQVESAVHKDTSDATFPGRSFGFTFDDIGNRTQTNTNGRTATYRPNDLNQYDRRQVPRALNVSGSADAGSTVTVNGNNATRRGEYFHHELDLSSDGNGSQQVNIQATATLPDGGDNNAPRIAEVKTSKYLPPNPEIFKYDADGNLIQDSRWFYTWDAENRLIEMKTRNIARNAGAPGKKLEFAYDSQGRRFSKKVYNWDTGSRSYQLTSDLLYLYDDWNLITELKVQGSTFDVQSSYVWGPDLSGSLQGAGGVGGLLMVTDAKDLTYYRTFDGNGNVMGYYAADTGESVAEFEYGAFGELIRATGAKKDAFNFRFSTKYEDAETGLFYYGYRYYDAETGRWLNKDPIEEDGGFNLYAFVYNDGVNEWDYLGLKDYGSGTSDPPLVSDPGAGAHNSISPTFRYRVMEQSLYVAGFFSGLPNASAHLSHYLGNSGSDYTINFENMLSTVAGERTLMMREVNLAKAYVETLGDGKHDFTSRSKSSGYVTKSESRDWFYATGGYQSWGKGTVKVSGSGSCFEMQFTYKMSDPYNWDAGKKVSFNIPEHLRWAVEQAVGTTGYVRRSGNKLIVEDKAMGRLHLMGLAKEFVQYGEVQKTYKWTKSDSNVTEVTSSGGGR